MRIVIMGASRIAASLVSLLEKNGDEVIVIDVDPDGFNRLPDDFKGEKIVGSGTDPAIYEKLNFGPDDGFVAATNSDNANIAAVKMIREKLNCQHVAKLIYDPMRAKAFREIEKGIICPILDAANHCKEAIVG